MESDIDHTRRSLSTLPQVVPDDGLGGRVHGGLHIDVAGKLNREVLDAVRRFAAVEGAASATVATP